MRRAISRRDVAMGAAVLTVAPVAATFPALAGGPDVHSIAIKSFAFLPATVRAKVGDTLRWTNADLAPHTATADNFGWDTGELATGQAFEIVVTAEMETRYFCVFHPHMTGQIEVI